MAQLFEVGQLVEVQTREGPGWKGGNGGVGKVRKINLGENGDIMSYDVKYIMSGSEKNVLPQYISVPGENEKRAVQAIKKFEPENFVANAEQRNIARSEVLKRRENKLKKKKTPKMDDGNVVRKKSKISKTNDKKGDPVSELEEVIEPSPEVIIPQGVAALQSVLETLHRVTESEEFEVKDIEAEIVNQNVTLDRTELMAAIAYLDEMNTIMLSQGVVYLI